MSSSVNRLKPAPSRRGRENESGASTGPGSRTMASARRFRQSLATLRFELSVLSNVFFEFRVLLQSVLKGVEAGAGFREQVQGVAPSAGIGKELGAGGLDHGDAPMVFGLLRKQSGQFPVNLKC